MSDPRLQAWLDATRALLAHAAGSEELDALVAARERLMRSLASEPPTEPAGDALSNELRDAENALASQLSALEASLRAQLAELHQIREANSGYRPAHGSQPAFVSRSV